MIVEPWSQKPRQALQDFQLPHQGRDDGKKFGTLGNAVNTVWNFCNGVSLKSAEHRTKWITKAQLRNLTKGTSRELGLPSHVIQEVINEFILKRGRGGVGNVSASWQIKSGKAQATLDMGWSMLRNLLKYKFGHEGVAFAEVDESYNPSRSECNSLGGPKGREGFGVRQGSGGECGTPR